jgi:Putative auto-transporter adhesin, head GIN domain
MFSKTIVNLVLLFIMLAMTFAFAETVRGSGEVVSEEREFTGFTGIFLTNMGDVVLTQGEQESLTIEAEDNLLPLLETTVRDGTLVLDVKEGTNLQPTKNIRYLITVTSLERLEISGAGDMSGSDLTLDTLSVDISGAGDVNLSGTASSVSVTVSGAGDYKACNLQSGTVSLEISGQGDAVVAATDSLTVDVSGMGDVSYMGSPELSQDVSGMGDITQISECSESE